MIKYLLDTNICIYLINGQYPEVLARLLQCQPEEVALSSITVFELQYGINKSKRKEENQLSLLKFLAPFEILDFNEEAAGIAGRIRADLEGEGQPIGPYDLLLAAQALKENLILVTHNWREFERISDLALEDWVTIRDHSPRKPE